MSQNEFEREVLDRLITIETKLEAVVSTCPQCQSRINALELASVKMEASTKSAHLRIDGVYKTVAFVAGAITLFMNIISFVIKQVAGG